MERVVVGTEALLGPTVARFHTFLRKNTRRKQFFNKPTPLQEWSSPPTHHRHEAWMELFFDLICVAAIFRLSAVIASHKGNWAAYFCVFVLYSALHNNWAHFTYYINRFHNEDLVHTLFYCSNPFFFYLLSLSFSTFRLSQSNALERFSLLWPLTQGHLLPSFSVF